MLLTTLLLSLPSSQAAPGDTCAEPRALPANGFAFGSVLDHVEAGPACGAPTAGPAEWFTFTAPADGSLSVLACEGSVPHQVSVYGGTCGALTCLDGVDDSCGSTLEIEVTAGEELLVAVHSPATPGDFTVTTSFAMTAEPPMDCTGRQPAVCQLVNRMVSLVNNEAGALVFTQSSSASRFRPTSLYQRILPIWQAATSNGCTVLGSMGGLYDLGAGEWHGRDFLGFFGEADAEGTVGPGVWEGTTGRFPPYGNRFGFHNNAGQIAASAGASDQAFAMGSWARIQGSRGAYTNVIGLCPSQDYADVFEAWYVGDLPGTPILD